MRPLRRSAGRWSLALVAAAALAACGGSAADPAPGAPAAGSEQAGSGHSGSGHAGSGQAPAALPSPHVHGVDVNPADGLVYLATHDGLFRYDEAGPVQVGDVVDLMGFTVAGPDHFYASGHPGPGSDLPNPVGLVESTDAGRTWTPLSRQGRSDFHALAASTDGVIGFDGTLRASGDGTTWTDLPVPAAPYALAVSEDGDTVLATTEAGPLRSGDGGRTWAPVEGAPLLMVVDWAGAGTVAGVTPDGQVAVSDDAGLTWAVRGDVGGRPQAVSASTGEGGDVRVLVVDGETVLDSTDGGRTFRPLG